MSFRAADSDKALVHGAFILTPKPEFFDEVAEGLSRYAEILEANEPDTLVFSVTKSCPAAGQEGPSQLAVAMVFKNEAAVEFHRSNSYSKEIWERSKDNHKLLCPPEIRTLTPIDGYMRRVDA
ncbi:hypothetical protein PVAG01_09798 [Phlyctema vagabunda]|uniref:ABM domain-containing protein n=1 Tax=Phlyctema vagabunda TaxID=108571 RepID=A0ABR4P446_9HELO